LSKTLVFTSRESFLALLGTSGALGPLLGRSWAFWGPPWADPGSLPWAPGAPRGVSWASLGPPMGLSWPLLGCPGRFLGLSWASFGGSGAALSSKRRHFTKPRKTKRFLWFLQVLVGFGEPPGGSWGPLGGPWGSLARSWAALGTSWVVWGGSVGLLGRPKWLLGGFWVALARPQGVAGVAQFPELRRPHPFFYGD